MGEDELRRLYVDQQLTLAVIAAEHGCSLTSVWRWVKAAGIPTREGGLGPRYARADFSHDVCEKAYLLGFRVGDLHVALEGTRTIVVKCTSTRPEQIELFRLLFEPYGHVYTDEGRMAHRRRQTIGMETRLNRTFDFLLPKEDRVPEWVLERDDTFFAFLAGYMDAEGYVNTYLPRGYLTPQVRVEVRSYDTQLLNQLSQGLNARGVTCPPARLRVKAGYVNRAGVRSNRDLWGLGICRQDSLLVLFTSIDPYLRHGKRRSDMMLAWKALTSVTNKYFED